MGFREREQFSPPEIVARAKKLARPVEPLRRLFDCTTKGFDAKAARIVSLRTCEGYALR